MRTSRKNRFSIEDRKIKSTEVKEKPLPLISELTVMMHVQHSEPCFCCFTGKEVFNLCFLYLTGFYFDSHVFRQRGEQDNTLQTCNVVLEASSTAAVTAGLEQVFKVCPERKQHFTQILPSKHYEEE